MPQVPELCNISDELFKKSENHLPTTQKYAIQLKHLVNMVKVLIYSVNDVKKRLFGIFP